jgi:hypothetical protein
MSKKANPTPITTNEDVIDLDLSVTKKKRFRLDKDDNRIIELNTSDVNIIARLSDSIPKLRELQEEAGKISQESTIETTDEESLDNAEQQLSMVADTLRSVDRKMRDLIDFIFDSEVSDVAAPDGSMYDVFNGSYRYEHILTLLMNQYESNMKAEYAKINKQLQTHTDKYTGRK